MALQNAGRFIEAFENQDAGAAGEAIGQAKEETRLSGRLIVTYDFSHAPRGWARHEDMKINPGSVAEGDDRAAVIISVPDSQDTGESGFALRVKGISRLGETWGGVKWAKVQSMGTVKDSRPDSVGANISSVWNFADCVVVSDRMGRTETTRKVRVFSLTTVGQAVNDVIGYTRDDKGIAHKITEDSGLVTAGHTHTTSDITDIGTMTITTSRVTDIDSMAYADHVHTATDTTDPENFSLMRWFLVKRSAVPTTSSDPNGIYAPGTPGADVFYTTGRDCDWKGSENSATSHRLYMNRLQAGHVPDLTLDDVVGYVLDTAGIRWAVTDYLGTVPRT
jgi:hypothetical protein